MQYLEKLKSYLGDNKLVILDEAQKITNIGLILKILIDTYPDLQIIATGSSSFDLANKINEPLTGRTWTFILYPFSIPEINSEARDFVSLSLVMLYLDGYVINLFRFHRNYWQNHFF